MKKSLLTTILCIAMIACSSTVALSQETTQATPKVSSEKSSFKRCPCKKIFQERLKMTKEQIELADNNREKEAKELKPLNTEIKANYKKIQEIEKQNLKEELKTSKIKALKANNTELKQKKSEIKAKYTKNFESYLNDEQNRELQKMRKEKKAGKSCCPCGKNRYY